MKRLLIHGDPGVSRDDRIRYDDEEVICFQVTRNGDWHGPTRPQLWCIVGSDDERERYQDQQYIPHFLETQSVAAEDVYVQS